MSYKTVLRNILFTLVLINRNPVAHLLNQVKACRRRLMSGPFVAEFSFLLDSGKDGIEVEPHQVPGLHAYSLQTPVHSCLKGALEEI